MRAEFQWARAPDEIAGGICGDASALLAAAERWRALYAPFVPVDTGRLRDDVRYGVEGSAGVVIHLAPYASAVYNGAAGRFARSGNPLASARWDQAAAAAGRGTELAASIEARYRGQ